MRWIGVDGLTAAPRTTVVIRLSASSTTQARWEEEGACEFDARMFIALDEDGCEIDGTQCGDDL